MNAGTRMEANNRSNNTASEASFARGRTFDEQPNLFNSPTAGDSGPLQT
jgi:hypothetical protein